MMKKMYESMTLYKPGIRLGKSQIAQMTNNAATAIQNE